jgi:hypothetical protein
LLRQARELKLDLSGTLEERLVEFLRGASAVRRPSVLYVPF